MHWSTLLYIDAHCCALKNIVVHWCSLLCLRQGLYLIIVSLDSAGLQKGLFPIGITSIEKRFGFESWMTGLLFTTYDIGFILSSLFVTYNLRNMGVPRIIAWALVLFSVGSLLFALPHFLTDLYQYTSTDREGIFDLWKCEISNVRDPNDLLGGSTALGNKGQTAKFAMMMNRLVMG